MSSTDFLRATLSGFAASLQPLREAVGSADALAAFLRQFGWTLAPADLAHVMASVTDLSSLSSDPSSLSLEDLTSEIVSAAEAVRRISSSGASAAFASTFPRELLDFLVYAALAQQSAPLFGVLHFVGVLDERQVPADSATGRGEHIERQVHWDRLSSLADDPVTSVRRSYGWGATFDADAFLRSTGILVRAFGGNAGLFPPDPRLIGQYYARGASERAGQRNLIVSVPELSGSVASPGASANVKLAFLAIGIPPSPAVAGPVDGLALMPVITGKAADSVVISDAVTLTLSGDFLARPVRAELHPGSAVAHATPGDAHVDATVRVDAKAPPQAPWRAFGDAGSSRLEISASHASFGMSGQLDGDLDLKVEVGLDTGALAIDLGEADGFVRNAVSSQPSRSPLSIVLKWSTKSGFSIGGQPKLQLTIPVQQTIAGVATVQSIGFSLSARANQRAELDALLTVSTDVGPLTATISDVGLGIQLAYLDDTVPPGNLGNLDLQFGFKPPSGVGLAIDVAGLAGGGILDHDEAKKEYAGLLQLTFHTYKLTAFGLIATILPTGPGYSLIAMVDADFPPIQLGLGFMLTGAGGLMGVHRTANVDAMRAALTAHTLSNLLFPKDPIANAPQLLTELDTLFPPANGRFLFGPLARIEWGTPALLTVDIALLLELPDPVRLVLIAELTVLLPTPDKKLVEIHVSALGAIDFGASTGSLDAVLHDSRLMKFTLHGAMALRVAWAGKKTMLLAVGGVHPKFQPPPGFPKLDRLGISMPSGPITKFNLDGYLAITTNTLQIGAHVDMFVGIDGFGISGYLSFDTLIQRHPFHFDGDISGGVTLSVDGHDVMALRLAGSLTGPGPWHAAGSVSFDVAWWTVTKSFSETFGDAADGPQPERIDVGQLLRTALADARNFAAQPSEASALVSLRTPVTATTGVLAHPGASLSVHQTVVPLGLNIAKYGGAEPLGETRFDITAASVDGATPPLTLVLDDFAPAQFLTLSDDDKLASPSFERLAAGVEVDGQTIFGASMTRTVAYQTFYVDTLDGPLRDEGGLPAPFPLGVLTGVLVAGSAGRSQVASTGKGRYAGPRHAVMPVELDFAVATSDQLTAAGVGASAGLTYSQAQGALDAELAQHPERAGALLVAARYELAS